MTIKPITDDQKNGEWLVLYRTPTKVGKRATCVIGCWVDKLPCGEPVESWCWPINGIDIFDEAAWHAELEFDEFFQCDEFTHFTPIAQQGS